MTLRKNLIANYLGQAWRGVIGLAFVPVYVRYLGIEAYGLIGVFAVFQSWLVLLDLGLRPALGREMARFTGGAHDERSILNMLRSVEAVVAAVAILVGCVTWQASGWIASNWLNLRHVAHQDAAAAIALMGLVAALQFVESLYVSCLAGLQLQVMQNAVSSLFATVRAVGSVIVLAWVSSSIRAFFVWHAMTSLVSAAVFAWMVYRVMSANPRSARLSIASLRAIGRFAGGTSVITLLALLLTQVDKIVLTRLLDLQDFGYYALAGVVANVLFMLAAPISAAYYPKLTETATSGDDAALARIYHDASQLMMVCVAPVALVVAFFGERLVFLWTGDPLVSESVASLVTVLAVGNLLNCLMYVPYLMQLAIGWTGLAIRLNAVAVALFVPTLLLVVPRYGALGAACVWVALNSLYVVVGVSLMHRRLLRSEMVNWYVHDNLIPILVGISIVAILHQVIPDRLSRMSEFAMLSLSYCATLMALVLAVPTVRRRLKRLSDVAST